MNTDTRKHSSIMHTQPLTVCASVATSTGGPQVNKFEQVSSLSHQMSLVDVTRAGDPCTAKAHVQAGGGDLEIPVQ